MTKKDYIKIASIINDISDDDCGEFYTDPISKTDLISKLSNYFQKDNPNFDKGKFKKACFKNTKFFKKVA